MLILHCQAPTCMVFIHYENVFNENVCMYNVYTKMFHLINIYKQDK